jgi:hypothetical protein
MYQIYLSPLISKVLIMGTWSFAFSLIESFKFLYSTIFQNVLHNYIVVILKSKQKSFRIYYTIYIKTMLTGYSEQRCVT